MTRILRPIGLCLVVAVAVTGSAQTTPARPLASLPPLQPFTDLTAPCTKVASTKGSDSSVGSRRKPFRTPQRLARVLRPGQVGCLRAGVYETSSEFVLDLARGRITIRSYPGERATIVGIVQVRPSAVGARLAGLNIIGTGGRNTVKVYAADVVLEDNDVTNEWRGRSCLLLGNREVGSADRPVVRRNRFHECGDLNRGNLDHAIYAAQTADGLITENLFRHSAAYSIQFYPNAQRTVFSHNIVDGDEPSVRGGVVFGGDGDTASGANRVEFNVIAYARTFNVGTAWSHGEAGEGNLVRSNCLWGARLGDIRAGAGLVVESNLTADPGFEARAVGSFRLSQRSPCLAVIGYDPTGLVE